MKNTKSIDRLFQEKFKDFEVEPDSIIWKNIESVIHEKKKKKILPLWFKIGGIAAALLIGVFVVNFMYTENQDVVLENNKELNEGDFKTVNNTKRKKNIVTSASASGAVKITNEVSNNLNRKTSDKSKDNSNAIVVDKTIENRKIILKNRQTDKNIALQESKITRGIASKTNNNSESAIDSAKSKVSKAIQNTTNTSIASSKNIKNKRLGNSKLNISNTTNIRLTQSGSISQKNSVKPIKKSKQNALANNTSTGNNESNQYNQNTVVIENRENQNVIPSSRTIENHSEIKLTPEIKSETLNALAMIEKEKEQEKEKKKSDNKKKDNNWLATSNVAPLFFNVASSESAIDPALNSYQKSFENNVSLGFGMSYAISKKIAIRSGLNRLSMNYNTNEVYFRAGFGKSVMKNMISADNRASVEVVGRPNVSNAQAGISEQKISEGIISQRIGYFEMPLEVSYSVLNKKLSVDLIGGFSTLFLTENQISMRADGLTTNLGQASNLNDVNFSSNLGIGIRYQFWKSFQAKFEPTFKYQLNTFTNETAGINPYFFGVYTGLSFGF